MTTESTKIAPDVGHYLALLDRIPWFLRLGQAHPLDSEVVRIRRWEDWPGPEGGWGDWFGRWPAFVRECIEADESNKLAELELLWQTIQQVVLKKAALNVPLYDSKRDPWHGPTLCVWDAAYLAGLVGWHIFLNRPMGWIIAERWKWLADGHWPCDFAEEPEGIDEKLIEIPRVKLLVF